MKKLLTVPEIAKYLGVHEMTVYRLAKSKKLPMFKVGGSWRTTEDAIESLFKV